MSSWKAADIPDLDGRVALVTGANSGLGFETAKALVQHGAHVIVACRDEERCSAAGERLRAMDSPGRIETELLDLADLDSVRALAGRVGERHDALDILVNNAGVMATPERLETKQGFELQFGTNHLGHFALTGLLMPLLRRANAARVVTVSSFAHESGTIAFDDLQRSRSYSPYGAYTQSKLANLLFACELDRRLRSAGSTPISVAAHPGFVSTQLQATGPFIGANPLASRLVLGGVRLLGQSAEEGAEPQLYAATAPGVEGGDYIGPMWWYRGHPAPASMSTQARDAVTAARLWDVSAQLTGIDIDAALFAGGWSAR